MALSIKDPETEAIAREVAQRKHLSITQAVKVSLEKELAGMERAEQERYEKRVAAIQKLRNEVKTWTVADPRPHGEILYDEDGLPV